MTTNTERQMLDDDEVTAICEGMRDYLRSLNRGRWQDVAAREIFNEMLLFYARKYGYVSGPTARQMTNLTDADKRAIEERWDALRADE